MSIPPEDRSRVEAPSPAQAAPRRHLLITGSGRAGTSFLVRYLTEAGLDTHLSRRGPRAWFDENANAGLEDMLTDPNPPYVVKNTWAFEMIEEILSDPTIHIDGVIIPMRDLAEAASSRVVLERQSFHRQLPWLSQLQRSWDHACRTTGGVVYYLDPVDQARLLAVGFHRLLECLVRTETPMCLLSFPRLTEDGEYLHRQLRDWLPAAFDLEQGLQAHARIADAGKVRMGDELASAREVERRQDEAVAPSAEAMDRIALGREVARLNRDLVQLKQQLADAEAAKRVVQDE